MFASATGGFLIASTASLRTTSPAIRLNAAGGMIGLMLIFYFRSIRLGLYALIPNMLPVVLYFGLLGSTGITLNNSTALMGSIVLGIATDDTLHLLVEYRRGRSSARHVDTRRVDAACRPSRCRERSSPSPRSNYSP